MMQKRLFLAAVAVVFVTETLRAQQEIKAPFGMQWGESVERIKEVVGKQGYEYLIRDPGGRYKDGLYFLSEFGSPIEALRFYRKLERPPAGTVSL